MIWFGDIKFDTHRNHSNYFAGGLSWYVYDVAQVIATKITKKSFHGQADRGFAAGAVFVVRLKGVERGGGGL